MKQNASDQFPIPWSQPFHQSVQNPISTSVRVEVCCDTVEIQEVQNALSTILVLALVYPFDLVVIRTSECIEAAPCLAESPKNSLGVLVLNLQWVALAPDLDRSPADEVGGLVTGFTSAPYHLAKTKVHRGWRKKCIASCWIDSVAYLCCCSLAPSLIHCSLRCSARSRRHTWTSRPPASDSFRRQSRSHLRAGIRWFRCRLGRGSLYLNLDATAHNCASLKQWAGWPPMRGN